MDSSLWTCLQKIHRKDYPSWMWPTWPYLVGFLGWICKFCPEEAQITHPRGPENLHVFDIQIRRMRLLPPQRCQPRQHNMRIVAWEGMPVQPDTTESFADQILHMTRLKLNKYSRQTRSLAGVFVQTFISRVDLPSKKSSSFFGPLDYRPRLCLLVSHPHKHLGSHSAKVSLVLDSPFWICLKEDIEKTIQFECEQLDLPCRTRFDWSSRK